MNSDNSPYKKHAEGLRYLADLKKKQEIYPDNPDGESLAKLEMIKELQDRGFNYSCFSDLELSAVRSKDVMRVLLYYYPRMESYHTKQTILTKIDPRAFPEIIPIALQMYLEYSPYERIQMTGLQQVLARAKMTPEHLDILYDLVKGPDGYASGSLIVEKLCKCIPERMRELSFSYCDGILLFKTLRDFYCYKDDESISKLEECTIITDERIETLKKMKNYSLSVSLYEYYLRFFKRDTIQAEAKRLLQKIYKQNMKDKN